MGRTKRSSLTEPLMSSSWKARQDRILLPIGDGGFSRADLIDLKCPSIPAVSRLRRVMKIHKATTLEELARATTLDEFLDHRLVSEVTANVFCHLLDKATRMSPSRWLGKNPTKFITRKEKLNKKKRKRKKR
jgi:hypothetical protein